MDDLTTERRFDSQASWLINTFGLFFDMLAIGVFTTRHWQTSGRLVQEYNVCTVAYLRAMLGVFLISESGYSLSEYDYIKLSVHG